MAALSLDPISPSNTNNFALDQDTNSRIGDPLTFDDTNDCTRYSLCERTFNCFSRSFQFNWTLTVVPIKSKTLEYDHSEDRSTSTQGESAEPPDLIPTLDINEMPKGEGPPLAEGEYPPLAKEDGGIKTRVAKCASRACSSILPGAAGVLIGAGIIAMHQWSKATQNS